jgi:hypothetical protein
MELKDNKHFSSRNRSFIAAAFMQHGLDANYKPVAATEIGIFKEMQMFMYAVFESKLKVNGWSVATRLHVIPTESTKNLPIMPQAP